MDNTKDDTAPAAIVDLLERLGVTEMLTSYVPRQHVIRRVSWTQFERFVQEQGYRVIREGGNLYGKIGLRPADPAPAPVVRIVTRSDVAAQYGSGRNRTVA